MGDNADGRIVIDTELDNTGFEKGSKEMISKIEGLTESFNNMGIMLSKVFEDSIIPALNTAADNTADILELMRRNSSMAAEAGQKAASSEQQISQEAQKATQAILQQAEAAKNVSGAMSNISASAKDVSAGTDAAGKSADAYQKQIDRTQAKIDTLKAKLADYYASADKIQNPAPEEDWLRGVEDPEQIATALKVEEMAMESLNKKYASQLAQLKNLEDQLARLKTLQQEAANAPKELSDSAAVKSLASEISKTETKLSGYQAKMEKMTSMGANSSAWKNIQLDIDATKAKLDEYKAKLEQLNASGGISKESYGQLSQTLAQLTENQGSLSSFASAGSRVNAFLGTFGNALKSAGRTALSTAKNMARMPFSAMKSGLKAVTSRLKEFIAHSKRTELSAKSLIKSLTSLKRLMITRVKRMFISAIFNEMKEAMNQLTSFSSVFNRSVSNIKNNATQLSANLATLMSRLIVAVEPALTKIISAVSTAMSYLNAFFAMLGGKKTMVVAKKQTASYADSLDKSGKAAKELNRQLMGFDEINRMDKKDSDTAGSGSGSDLFEEVPIDSVLPAEVSAYFERLKSAIKAGDWEGAGKIIAEGLNSGMAVVDKWINTVLRPMGVKWSGQVARILNGLTTGFDWRLMGQALADGMNAAFDILNTFLTTYDFKNLGKGIGASIYSWFDNVEWDLIGQTFANKWNALIDTVHGIVTTPGIWTKIGASIGTFIGNLFSTLDYTTAAEAFVAGFNGIFTALQNIVNVVNWDSIAQSIYTGLNLIVHGINWEAAGESLSDAVVSLLGVIRDVVVNTDWYALGQGIGHFLASIDWVTIISEVGEALWQAFSGMIAGLFSTSGGKVVVALGAGLLALKGLFSVGKFALSSAVSSWVMGGTGALALLPQAASALVGGLGSILGAIGSVIFSPTGAIIAGIAIGVGLIIANWDKIKEAAGKVKDYLAEKWTQIEDITSNMASKMKNSMINAARAIQNQDWSTIGSNICTGIHNGLVRGWKWLSSTVSTIASNLLRSAKNALGIHSPSRLFRDEIGENIGLGWAEGIEGTEGTVLRTVANVAKSITDSAKSDVPEIQYSGDSLLTGLDAVAAKLSGVADIFQNITNMLSSVPTFSVPDIATGTVVPYRTKVEDTNALYGANTSLQIGQTDMIRELRQMFDSVIRAIEEKDTNISIGDDQFDGIIASSKHRRNLRSGGYA